MRAYQPLPANDSELPPMDDIDNDHLPSMPGPEEGDDDDDMELHLFSPSATSLDVTFRTAQSSIEKAAQHSDGQEDRFAGKERQGNGDSPHCRCPSAASLDSLHRQLRLSQCLACAAFATALLSLMLLGSGSVAFAIWYMNTNPSSSSHYGQGNENLPLLSGIRPLASTDDTTTDLCPNGGILVDIIERGANHVNTVTSSFPICNGMNGVPGPPGESGIDPNLNATILRELTIRQQLQWQMIAPMTGDMASSLSSSSSFHLSQPQSEEEVLMCGLRGGHFSGLSMAYPAELWCWQVNANGDAQPPWQPVGSEHLQWMTGVVAGGVWCGVRAKGGVPSDLTCLPLTSTPSSLSLSLPLSQGKGGVVSFTLQLGGSWPEDAWLLVKASWGKEEPYASSTWLHVLPPLMEWRPTSGTMVPSSSRRRRSPLDTVPLDAWVPLVSGNRSVIAGPQAWCWMLDPLHPSSSPRNGGPLPYACVGRPFWEVGLCPSGLSLPERSTHFVCATNPETVSVNEDDCRHACLPPLPRPLSQLQLPAFSFGLSNPWTHPLAPKSLSIGRWHALALDGNGTLFCWGWNVHGECQSQYQNQNQYQNQVTTGTWRQLQLTPTVVEGVSQLFPISHACAGAGYSCVVSEKGKETAGWALTCWGGGAGEPRTIPLPLTLTASGSFPPQPSLTLTCGLRHVCLQSAAVQVQDNPDNPDNLVHALQFCALWRSGQKVVLPTEWEQHLSWSDGGSNHL
jgi:hypothetical protein